ncbi:MAG: LytR C-terminal domain-containing protein [Patescibacteria group bacterium]
MEDNPFPQPTLEKPTSKKKKRFVFLFFVIVLVLILIYLGSRFMGNSSSQQEEALPTPEEFVIPTDIPTPAEESPAPTEEAKKTPTPTAKASRSASSVDKTTGLDRADLEILVQNGSGEKGVAGTVADVLKGLGYAISSTGNADNFDYSDITIQVKSAQKDFLPILKKDLAGSYTIGSATSDLPASASYDALVIVGK